MNKAFGKAGYFVCSGGPLGSWMSAIRLLPYLLFLLLFGHVATAADSASVGELTLHVAGFLHTKGHTIAKLFSPGDNVLGAGRRQARTPIDGNTAVLRFEGLPAGRYAVVVFHDENDNALIDHGLLGPVEPIGFSGGFALGLLSGRPDFEKTSFEYKPPIQTLELRIK